MEGGYEYRKGERFAIRGDQHEWIIDRTSRQVSVTRRSMLGRSTKEMIPLDELVGVTVRLSPMPPMSLASVIDMLRTAIDVAKSEQPSSEQLASRMSKGLFVRLDEQPDGRGVRETSLGFPVSGVEDEGDMVAIAYQIADAAGLGFCGVFALPGVGVEVRLSRSPQPRLEALGEFADEVERQATATAAVAVAGIPPFEPHRLQSSYKVDEWDPGHRVVFRRPFSKWALPIFPFTLLVLVGPGIVFTGLATGREPNIVNTLILTVVAAAFGVPALALFLGMLPRSVVFDWPSGMLSIRRWASLKSIPIARIRGLEAHARFYESSGDSGGSTTNYACELKARVRDASEADLELIDILETDHLTDPDRPVRDTFPLTVELAKALGVPYRFEDYSFRKVEKRSRRKVH